MQATIKASAEAEKNPDVEMIMNDIASLKRDIGSLAAHLKTEAIDGTTEAGRHAAARVSDRARQLYGDLAEQGQHSVTAVSRRVEERPLTSLLIAFALGLIGSRMLSR